MTYSDPSQKSHHFAMAETPRLAVAVALPPGCSSLSSRTRWASRHLKKKTWAFNDVLMAFIIVFHGV